ncbi:MAG: GDYXXLXY domain-containing protein [Woeseiaceae bacterium]|jgi:uncharacterized membrane-anchored protein|nr:GDYXXLXY domain-containing protein [Woeseiaceae bacterium]
MKRPGTGLVIFGLALVLGVANYTIWQKEHIRTGGREVLLELAPVDPRSLIQGDYMMLRYAPAVFPSREESGLDKGTLVVELDADGVGSFARIDDGTPLAPNEVRLRFRTVSQWGEYGIGAESFFFQEGHAEHYANARYGVLRVAESGDSVLVGLADENRALLEPPELPESSESPD